MKHYDTTFFGEAFCHASNDGANPEHKVSIKINGSPDDPYAKNTIRLFMSEIESISFKNSVISAHEKMFGRR